MQKLRLKEAKELVQSLTFTKVGPDPRLLKPKTDPFSTFLVYPFNNHVLSVCCGPGIVPGPGVPSRIRLVQTSSLGHLEFY